MSPETRKSRGSGRYRERAGKPRAPIGPVALVVAAAVALAGATLLVLRAPATPASAVAQAKPDTAESSALLPTVAASTNPNEDQAPAAAPTTAAAAASTDGKTAVTAQDGEVRLPVASLADGNARFYTIEAGGKTVEFFVLKGADGTIRAAFDACDVCFPYKKGYHQEGDVMVCNNCGSRFPSDKINIVRGGCNPAPVERRVDGDTLVIKISDLATGARFF